MEGIFMINQLMIQLSNTMKLEKYRRDMAVIILQAVCEILLISKKITE